MATVHTLDRDPADGPELLKPGFPLKLDQSGNAPQQELADCPLLGALNRRFHVSYPLGVSTDKACDRPPAVICRTIFDIDQRDMTGYRLGTCHGAVKERN